MPKILTIAFKGTVSEDVTKLLHYESKIISSSEEMIDKILLEIEDYDFVIGFGEYSGRDQEKLRIETMCNNKFRNEEIVDVDNLTIGRLLAAGPKSKYTGALGNSWCNLLCVRILNSNFKGGYAFIHIPKNFNLNVAKSEIENMLKQQEIVG